MEIFVYIIIFIMGSFIGSFASLAVYRIPIGQDILYTHSYCPNCTKKLSIVDLVPVWSYIFLGGKCRQCKEKIRIRYLMLEIFSGLALVLFVISTNFDIYNLNLISILNLIIYTIFITILVLFAGIDKEHININKKLMFFSEIFSLAFVILNIFIFKTNIIISIISFVFLLILNYINNIKNYYIDLIWLLIFTLMFITNNLFIINLFIIGSILIYCFKVRKSNTKKLPIGFIISCVTIITLIINNFYYNY